MELVLLLLAKIAETVKIKKESAIALSYIYPFHLKMLVSGILSDS